MIPEIDFVFNSNNKNKEMPSLTYKLDTLQKRIIGTVDGFDAIVQAIIKNFYTERDAYVIYDHHYGVNIEQYIGKDFDYVKSDIQRTLEECLLVDNRIIEMQDFSCELGEKLDDIIISMKLITVAGTVDVKERVNI